MSEDIIDGEGLEGLEDFEISSFMQEDEFFDDGFHGDGSEPSVNLLHLLCFELANEEYAIDIMSIKEIVKLREFTDVPRSPEFIVGIISLRGVIVPVFDLRKRLALDAKEHTRKTRIIISHNKENSKNWGMIVDNVIQVIRIPKDSIEPPPAVIKGISAEFITGVGRHEDNFVIIMNLQNVLDINV